MITRNARRVSMGKKTSMIIIGSAIGLGAMTIIIALSLILSRNHATSSPSTENRTTSMTGTSLNYSPTTIMRSYTTTLRRTYTTAARRNYSTTVTQSYSSIVTSNYSGVLTNRSNSFFEDEYSDDLYYEAVQVSVPVLGNYSFTSISPVDLSIFLYLNDYYPFNLCNKLLQEGVEDDDNWDQYHIQYVLLSDITYTLVITTYSPQVTGRFKILGSGPARVSFHRINNTAAPPTTGTTTLPLISLMGTEDVVYGIYNTSKGGNSMAATPGTGIGKYPPNELPGNACDNNITTKYLSFGLCDGTNYNSTCGLNTGFYVLLKRGASIATGLGVCTASDVWHRDPITVTLEGSNQPATNLTTGESWTLLYEGSTGLENVFTRSFCGDIQFFCNSIPYTNYRFLVTDKRYSVNSVQYSEVRLFGY